MVIIISCQLSEDHQKDECKEDTNDTNKAIESDEDGKLREQDKEKDVLDTFKDNSSSDSLTLECPFNCDEVPDSDWTVDTLFAHIFSKHWSDVKNNFFVSIDTFIERLGSQLSSQKCAFKCKQALLTFQLEPDL